MPNSGSTLSTPSSPFVRKQKSLAECSAASPTRPVHSTRPNGFQVRRPLAFGAVLQRQRTGAQLHRGDMLLVGNLQQKMGQTRNSSTLRHTRSTPSETMQIISSSLVPPTALQPRTFVTSPSALVDVSHRIDNRVNLNTGGSSVSIDARTRGSTSNTRLQNRKGCNVTTENTLIRAQTRRQARRARGQAPSTKAGPREDTTRSQRGAVAAWGFSNGHSAMMRTTWLWRYVSPIIFAWVID